MIRLKENNDMYDFSGYTEGELIALYNSYHTYVMGLEESGHPQALEARQELKKMKNEMDRRYDVEPDWEWMSDIARGR
jgi:hypothetical protein